jgi:AcrR family transcriptional regulator
MTSKDAKTLLVNALMELLKTIPLDKVDVLTLTRKAQLSRQTFYYNFKNKQDMINWILAENSQQAQRAFSDSYCIEDYFTSILAKIKAQKNFYDNVINSNYGITSKSMGLFEREIVRAVQETELQAASLRMDIKQWDALLFFAFGVKGIIGYWLKNGIELSVPPMVDFLMNNMPRPLEEYIEICRLRCLNTGI